MKRARKIHRDDDNLPLSFPEVGFERQALTLKRMSFERWLKLGEVLGQIEDDVRFYIGDYLNAGEKAYGEKYAQAVDERRAAKWQHYAWVARSVEKSRRRHILSFNHHQEVASLEADEQSKWLADAVENKWTVHALREKIRLSRTPERSPDWCEPLETPSVPVNCEVEDYPEVGEQISPARPDIERDFRHLLQLCKALLTAERGDLARGIKPSEDDAIRIRTALEVFIAQHD